MTIQYEKLICVIMCNNEYIINNCVKLMVMKILKASISIIIEETSIRNDRQYY